MNENDGTENLDLIMRENHIESLQTERNELLRTIAEKDERIAYLNAVIEAYEGCMQKFADLARKLGEKMRKQNEQN